MTHKLDFIQPPVEQRVANKINNDYTLQQFYVDMKKQRATDQSNLDAETQESGVVGDAQFYESQMAGEYEVEDREYQQ